MRKYSSPAGQWFLKLKYILQIVEQTGCNSLAMSLKAKQHVYKTWKKMITQKAYIYFKFQALHCLNRNTGNKFCLNIKDSWYT